MATVTMPDGREFEIADDDDAACAYYLGEGATVTKESAGDLELPATFDGEKYVPGTPEEPVLTEISAGTGEPMVGVEHPADGTWSPEISNEPTDASQAPKRR